MNFLVCGRMKKGKTTLALYLAEQHSPGRVAWDSKHDIVGAVYVTNSEELEDAIQTGQWRNGLIVFRPNGLRIEQDFSEMCAVLFNPPKRFECFSLVIDEAKQLQGPHSIDPYLDVAIRQHPRSVLIVQTTHSLQDWHRASKDLMTELYCFRLIGNSLESVVDYCDGGPDFRAAIESLPDHHCVRVNFEAAKGESDWEVWDHPELWGPKSKQEAVIYAEGNPGRESGAGTAGSGRSGGSGNYKGSWLRPGQPGGHLRDTGQAVCGRARSQGAGTRGSTQTQTRPGTSARSVVAVGV